MPLLACLMGAHGRATPHRAPLGERQLRNGWDGTTGRSIDDAIGEWKGVAAGRRQAELSFGWAIDERPRGIGGYRSLVGVVEEMADERTREQKPAFEAVE